jgi:type II secretory ATPase GspE/PulE/Tfp pilus assembly ATPase PilB-like protein
MSNIVKYIQHYFKDEIQNFVLNHDHLKIFDILTNETKELHVLKGTFGSGKTLFVKYLTHYLQTQGKNVFLITTTGASILRLSQHACLINTQFKIQV